MYLISKVVELSPSECLLRLKLCNVFVTYVRLVRSLLIFVKREQFSFQTRKEKVAYTFRYAVGVSGLPSPRPLPLLPRGCRPAAGR